MSFIDNRRSVRLYNDKKIELSDLKTLCEAGFLAANARNQDSRAFIIIDDKELINKLSTISLGAKVLENANYAIAVIGINKDNLTSPDFAQADLAASTQNILNKACELGIGSCWIGVHPVLDRTDKANLILGLKNDYCYSLIALGYPKDDKAFYKRTNKIKEEYIYYNKVK